MPTRLVLAHISHYLGPCPSRSSPLPPSRPPSAPTPRALSIWIQLARSLSVSPTTIERLSGRLGRHALLFHEQHRPGGVPGEPLVYDGFETFELSQYWPAHLNTVVGAESRFVYATTVAELRRKGRHTAPQKARRAELETRYGRPHPKAIERTTQEALSLAVPPSHLEVTLLADEHKAYPRALRGLLDRRFRLEQTSSRRPRVPGNPLQPVNHLHALMRHSGANFKRETLAWSKRRQSMVWRDCLFRVWRNWVKRTAERGRRETPAMRLGVTKRALGWGEVLGRRLFVTRWRLPAPLDRYYWGREPTRQIPNARAHGLRYAY